MTVTTTSNVARFQGDGSTTTFSVPFPFGPEQNGHGGTPDWLEVWLRDETTDPVTIALQDLTDDYTVSNGDVVFNEAPSSDEEIVIRRVVPLTQNIDFTNTGTFFPETVEEGKDKATFFVQQLDEKLKRAILFPFTSGLEDFEFPEPKKDRVLLWREEDGEFFLENNEFDDFVAEAGGLLAENNLSELTSASSARNNLGLGSAAVEDASAFEPANPNIQTHISATDNPHNVTPAQVGNTTAQWNADQIQGRNVQDTAPDDEELLEWNNAQARWDPMPGHNTARWNADRIQGRAVEDTDPASGDLMRWDGANNRWEPAPPGPATGGYTEPVEASINNDQDSAVNVSGMLVASDSSSEEIFVEITRSTDSEYRRSVGRLIVSNMDGNWEVKRGMFQGHNDGVEFSIVDDGSGNGQVQYTSSDLNGDNYEGAIKFGRFIFPVNV